MKKMFAVMFVIAMAVAACGKKQAATTPKTDTPPAGSAAPAGGDTGSAAPAGGEATPPAGGS